MSGEAPRVYADERGVWRQDQSGNLYGIAWEEIYSVAGYKLDGVTAHFTCLELDFEYGEFIELYHDWPGFEQVVEAITARLPGISADWFQQVQRLQVSEAPRTVWSRS